MTPSSLLRRRARALFSLCAVCSALALAACGADSKDDESDGGGTVSDAGGDGESGDGGGTTDTGPVVPENEPLWIVYAQEAKVESPSLPDYVQVMVATDECGVDDPGLCSSGECEPIEIVPPSESEPLCNNGCFMTPGMDWLVFFDAEESRTLRKIPIGDDFQVAGPSEIISADISSVSVGDGAVAYRTLSGDVSVHDLDGGTDTELGNFGSQAGIYLTPDGETVFVKQVTSLVEMALFRVSVSNPSPEELFTFIDGGPRNAAGSLLRGTEPTAVSPDGTQLAIVTNIRNELNVCTSNADCTEEGFVCPVGTTAGRCYQQQLTLNVINLTDATNLGGACSADADCGSGHFCDLSAPDSQGMGRCLPTQFILGPSGQNVCSRLGLGEYDQIRPDITWTSDSQVTALLENSCAGSSTGLTVTDLVTIDTTSGAITRGIENPGLGFGNCYDEVEACTRPEECTIELYSMAASPSGATVALIGDSYTGQGNPELWLSDALGRSDKDIVTRSVDFDIQSVQLFDRSE